MVTQTVITSITGWIADSLERLTGSAIFCAWWQPWDTSEDPLPWQEAEEEVVYGSCCPTRALCSLLEQGWRLTDSFCHTSTATTACLEGCTDVLGGEDTQSKCCGPRREGSQMPGIQFGLKELDDKEIFWETMKNLVLKANSGPTPVPRWAEKWDLLWHSPV